MTFQKLEEIEEKLKREYVGIKSRYIKLKRCKYFLLILKTTLLSLSIVLSFINPLIIIASSTIPIIDSIMVITEKDKKVSELKLQKDIINQLIKEIEIKNIYLEMMKRLKIILYKYTEKFKLFLIYKIYMTIINFDEIIGGQNNYATNNVFCLSHPTNFLLVGKTNSGKSNILMNLIAQNCIYEKIYIYTNNMGDKYTWLKNKFKKDVHIFINEINFSDIDKKYINLVVFDDLVFSNKKISTFFTQSRKSNVSCTFISHRYFTVNRLLRNNLDYIIFYKIR